MEARALNPLELKDRVRVLEALLNSPMYRPFLEAVENEAKHQTLRWGDEHDSDKTPEDWFWLLGYLSGKALRAHIDGDHQKALHHTISSAAVLSKWHAQIEAQMPKIPFGAGPSS